MKPHIKRLFFLLTIFLAACSVVNEQTKNPAAETQECIGNVEDFIYQLPTGLFYNIPEDIEGVLPKPSWEFVFEIPADSMDSYAYIETTREKDGEQEIWILTNAHYIVYQPEIDEHFIVPKNPQNASGIVKSVLSVEQLVVAQDGRLWGRNIIDDCEIKFDDNLLQDYYCAYYLEPRLCIETDADNNYWIFHPTNGLYKFNPVHQSFDEFHELRLM